MKNYVRLAPCLLALLAGCGGGGGNEGPVMGAEPPPREPLPTLSQDILPSGPTADYRSRNYFPMQSGDTWTYDRRPDGVSLGVEMTRSVTSASGSDVMVTESALGQSDSTVYRRTSDGIVAIAPMADGPASMNQLVGNILEYAEPFPLPQSEPRRVVRQGSTGEDLDGDGRHESFRLELRQTFVGIESVALPGGYRFENVARFHNVLALTLVPSDGRRNPQTVTSTEEAWWAPNVGLIRAERSEVDSSGEQITQPYTLVLTGGTVGGSDVMARTGRALSVPLLHHALVYDATRSRYYASVAGSVPVHGNQIAIVNPSDGSVSYSGRAVGSQPSALALHPSGTALYVALAGTGEVVKLSLPDLVEVWRVRLPSSGIFGQWLPQSLAVSPTDVDVVGVSLADIGGSTHGGVALIRNGVLQPRMTPEHFGSTIVTFGGDGSTLYGFNNRTTEYGLRRMTVLADGLQEAQLVAGSGDFGTRVLDWMPQGLLLNRSLYRASDLAAIGNVDVEGSCRAHRVPNRLVCTRSGVYHTNTSELAVVDATTQVILRTLTFGFALQGGSLSEIVPGAPGQLALRLNANYATSPADTVVLFSSVALE
jgi:hypothetical protein